MERTTKTTGAILLVLIGVLQPAARLAADPLVIGVFPRRNAEQTLQMFTPLAKHLEQRLGADVVVETAYDFSSFWAMVEARRYHLVHFNQYHYVRSNQESGYRVIAKNREFGSSTLRAVILVRRDSGIRQLSDLKGRKIVFGGGRDAMISYIAPTYILRSAGLDERDYLEGFALNPLQALLAVYYHQGAAAAVGHVVPHLPRIRSEVDTGELLEIASSEPLTQLPWAVRGDLPADLVEDLRSAMLDLESTSAGRRILDTMVIDGLDPANDQEYDVHRRIVRSVMKEDY